MSTTKILINTYREDVRLFINGETPLSQEGNTQGDPVAMAIYAIAVSPLIHQETTKQQMTPPLGESPTTCKNGGTASPELAQSMAMHLKHG